MSFTSFIIIFASICLALYLSAILVALCYELRMRALFNRKRQELAKIELLPVSFAVKYAKRFKVETDYRKMAEKFENKRFFIMSKVLHVRRGRMAC